MRKRQYVTIAAIVFGTMVFCSPHSNAASKDAYQNVFLEHLAMGPATYLNLSADGLSAAEIDKGLSDIYHGNLLQPFWIRDGKPDKRASGILAALEDAETHGLDPNSYFIDMIHQYWNSKDTVGLVRLDILLTLGMVRYIADQREGRLAPREVDPKLFAAARDVEVDWKLLLQTAFETQDIKSFLSQN